ncbi:hypothetical protein [Microvirga thermotolerans]|uniref:Uncharacterized protein n=1 Tax=Microvirga thermotolerans TaxID=2651334 RepID=A0A5P9JRR8_9HYPH|nr:hypothetical protein [Microvirga thermotolerans]QFU15063.1 hypothetical protein GDR74_01875 [Microvirga thermotolerans]
MLRQAVAAAAFALAVTFAGASGAAAQGLVPCAREHGFCRVPYPTRVVYGVPGREAVMDVAGRGIPCSNEVFGDPAPGIPKRCAYVARSYGGGFERPLPRPHRDWPGRRGEVQEIYETAAWRTCAGENGFCGFRGVRRVRYGAHGRYAEGVYRGGVGCNNGTFGDPVPGVRKHCQVLD